MLLSSWPFAMSYVAALAANPMAWRPWGPYPSVSSGRTHHGGRWADLPHRACLLVLPL